MSGWTGPTCVSARTRPACGCTPGPTH